MKLSTEDATLAAMAGHIRALHKRLSGLEARIAALETRPMAPTEPPRYIDPSSIWDPL